MDESAIGEDIDKKIRSTLFLAMYVSLTFGDFIYILIINAVFNKQVTILQVILGLIIFSASYFFDKYSKSTKHNHLFNILVAISISALLPMLWSWIRWTVISDL